MGTILLGLALLIAAVFVLLLVLSPKGEERPLVFTCQACGTAFSSPPLHPLPERYQEEDLCLCEACGARLEESVREAVRRTIREFTPPR